MPRLRVLRAATVLPSLVLAAGLLGTSPAGAVPAAPTSPTAARSEVVGDPVGDAYTDGMPSRAAVRATDITSMRLQARPRRFTVTITVVDSQRLAGYRIVPLVGLSTDHDRHVTFAHRGSAVYRIYGYGKQQRCAHSSYSTSARRNTYALSFGPSCLPARLRGSTFAVATTTVLERRKSGEHVGSDYTDLTVRRYRLG